MKKLATIASMVLGLTIAFPGKASAQTEPPPGPAPVGYYVPPHEHNGFFARVYLGPAYVTSSADSALGKATVKGSGAFLGVSAGAAVNPNIIIYGELFADAVVGPTF